jgi:hypothetical protein
MLLTIYAVAMPQVGGAARPGLRLQAVRGASMWQLQSAQAQIELLQWRLGCALMESVEKDTDLRMLKNTIEVGVGVCLCACCCVCSVQCAIPPLYPCGNVLPWQQQNMLFALRTGCSSTQLSCCHQHTKHSFNS